MLLLMLIVIVKTRCEGDRELQRIKAANTCLSFGGQQVEGGGSELNIDQCSGATATVPFSER